MKIIEKKVLGQLEGVRIVMLKVIAPQIASKARPGQFIALMVSEEGERIPLTVVDADLKQGAVTLIFQEAGLTTRMLGALGAGDSLYSIVGPLGHATEIRNYGRVVIIGGGVGIAEIYPVAKALKEAGNKVITILGARTRELLILEKELKAVSHELHATTDDGTCGRKGFVTDALKEILNETTKQRLPAGQAGNNESTNLIYAVGPIPMMKSVAAVGRQAGIKTIVSLNALMVDATGMCGCCRVTVAGKMKFSCVDGPEFDAAEVDWDELEKRNRIYCEQEKHICKLKLK